MNNTDTGLDSLKKEILINLDEMSSSLAVLSNCWQEDESVIFCDAVSSFREEVLTRVFPDYCHENKKQSEGLDSDFLK